MIGAIVGDIVGSRFEWGNLKSKEFELFSPACGFTDDSVMSLAVCEALLESSPGWEDLAERAVACMRTLGRRYPGVGYGGRFLTWLHAVEPRPYRSYGNGAAMRVSGCGFAASSLGEAEELARVVTAVTHDHPEGIKGAQATAAAVYLARTGSSMDEIRAYIAGRYYPWGFASTVTLDAVRPRYTFDVSCQGSVPQALEAFFESTSFEDAIRNAVSIGGDSDTIAAIAGGVAEAYYGVPGTIRERAVAYLTDDLRAILVQFEGRYPM